MRAKPVLFVVLAVLLAGLLPGISAASSDRPGHVDVLFIGAHPDDEHDILSTLGQWNEDKGLRAGVVTISRGEGGGNAVGPEEGPPLGELREGEERRAVARAGIQDVHYLDKADFFYTVSAPLTRKVWNERDTLSRIVRLVRETTPSMIVTMDPRPKPGQHGNHQEAGRLAAQAYRDAADPGKFTEQRLPPWRTAKLFQSSADGNGPDGPDCARTFRPEHPERQTYGVWEGARSAEHRRSWAAVEAAATREYLSQGFGDTEDPPADPRKIGCDRFTQLDSRVPYSPSNTAADAMLEGAAKAGKGGLPKGTELRVSVSEPNPRPGTRLRMTAHARPAPGKSLHGVDLTPRLPTGWRVSGNGELGDINDGQTKRADFEVTVPENAKVDTGYRLGVRLHSANGSGENAKPITLSPLVSAKPERLPQFTDFDDWAKRAGMPELSGQWENTVPLRAGGSRELPVTIRNGGTQPESGTVQLRLPKGFRAESANIGYTDLAPGTQRTVNFKVTNTDPRLPTANQGDYRYSVATDSSGTSGTTSGELDLLPSTSIGEPKTKPKLDGVEQAGEYPGERLPISRPWQGDDCQPADCSGYAKVSRQGDSLRFLVRVNDDRQGAVLSQKDCKRHWRTDSVELELDPRGNAENTASTFKTGILPFTTEGGPCFERDADNHQGGAETAPGMRVASKVDKPYTGYTIEAEIPMSALPAAVDPNRLGLNVLAYDSDNQNKTDDTRIGWSPYEGVQGDPYRWGKAKLPGYQPPASRPTKPSEPVIADSAARSVRSPDSISQSVRTGIPLAGEPNAPAEDTARPLAARTEPGAVTVDLRATGPGRAHLFIQDPRGGTLGSRELEVRGDQAVRIPVSAKPGPDSRALLAFEARSGGIASASVPLS